jgi:hypothetical protein
MGREFLRCSSRQDAVQKFILQSFYNSTDSQADSPTMGIVSDAPSRTRFAGGVAGYMNMYSERNLIYPYSQNFVLCVSLLMVNSVGLSLDYPRAMLTFTFTRLRTSDQKSWPMRRVPVERAAAARGDGTPSTLRSSPSKAAGARSRTGKKKKKASGSPLAGTAEEEDEEEEEVEVRATTRTSLAAANACAQLVATAATVETAARLQKLLHGDLAEQAIAALLAIPSAIAGLLEAASSSSTSTEARVRLLGSIAACRESGPFKELDPEAEREAVSACLSILAEPDASVELQASTRRLLRTAQLEPLREACVAAPTLPKDCTPRCASAAPAVRPPTHSAAVHSPNSQA